MTDSENDKVRVIRQSGGETQPEVKPIVLKLKKRKKKAKAGGEGGKEKYSPGLEDVQRAEGDMVRIAQRASKALTKGIDAYEHGRPKSAKGKKNGAIEDFMDNSAKAASAYIKEVSELPVVIAESVSRTSLRKRLRRSLRRASGAIRMWRI